MSTSRVNLGSTPLAGMGLAQGSPQAKTKCHPYHFGVHPETMVTIWLETVTEHPLPRTPSLTPYHPSHHTVPHPTPSLTPHRPSHHTVPHTTPSLTPYHPSHHTVPHTTPPLTPHRPSHHTTPHTTPSLTPRHPSYHQPVCSLQSWLVSLVLS